MLFFDIITIVSSSTLSCEFGVHRAGSQLKMSERQTKAGNQITLSLSLTLTLSHYLTLSHSHTHSISHSITLDMLNNFCFHLYAQNSPSHFLTLSLSHYLTLSHSLTLSIFHSITLDMLNNFSFHVYAQMLLFIDENVNVFFFGPQQQHPLLLL